MIYIAESADIKNLQVGIIQDFKKNLIHSQLWDQTRLIRIKDGFYREDDPSLYDTVKKCVSIIQEAVNFDERFRVIQDIEIVKYPTGSSKTFHYDNTRKTTTGASITYLNDDYIGGQTVVEGVSIQPLSGRTVYFDGKAFKHNVMNVIKGSRYTISIWYGADENSCLVGGI
jgi:hypothetical protein